MIDGAENRVLLGEPEWYEELLESGEAIAYLSLCANMAMSLGDEQVGATVEYVAPLCRALSFAASSPRALLAKFFARSLAFLGKWYLVSIPALGYFLCPCLPLAATARAAPSTGTLA